MRLEYEPVTAIPVPSRSVAIRPLALPNEHGGWGFLFEPIVLGLAVAGSGSGVLIAVAALAGFLVRHPLRLALQDAMRRRTYPRTKVCWTLALSYLLAAAAALALAVMLSGLRILIPFAIVAPFAVVQIVYDALNRSRDLLPELCGATAMSSTAAAIAMSGGMDLVPALGVAGIIVARSLPSIVYVRTLLRPRRRWPAIAMHAAAIPAVAYASYFAVAAMVVLLARAVWGLTHQPPRAKTIGWREIVFGAITVTLAAIGYHAA